MLTLTNLLGDGTWTATKYNGLYFTDSELRELAGEGRLLHVPVKAEHRGQELGRVVSSFVDAAGRLNCVMRKADDTEKLLVADCSGKQMLLLKHGA